MVDLVDSEHSLSFQDTFFSFPTEETFDALIDQVLEEDELMETNFSSNADLVNNSSMLISPMKPTKKKKKSTKRPTNNPKFIPAIRILRRDIRRKYAEMMTNVLNSYDLKLHRRFLEEFGHPDLIRILRSYPSDFFEKLNHKTRLEGIDSLIEGISRQYLAIPDIIFQMSDVKVCQRLNTSGSKIIATTMVRGTMLYSIVPVQKYSIQDNNNHNSKQVLSEKEDDTNQVLLELLDKQIDYCTAGIVTISLDDQHRFLSICIEVEKV